MRTTAASRISSRNTAFQALTKPGKGLAHVKRTTKRTNQVLGWRSIRTSSKDTAFPALTKLGRPDDIST